MRIALIGCGRQGYKHAAALRKCSNTDLIVADQDQSLAQALANQEGVAWARNLDEVFEDPQVSAVNISVPTPFHAPLIRRALAAGKDFFCEKPLCETSAQAQELFDEATRAGRLGVVGYVYRQAPVFREVRSLLRGADVSGTSEVIGQISMVMMRIGGRGSAAIWKHRASGGGGAVNEMLVHMLDLAVWWLGPVRSADLLISDVLRPERMIGGRLERADAEDFVVARFQTLAGIPIIIQADLITPAFAQSVEIQGDNGTIVASIQHDMPQFVFTLGDTGSKKAGRRNLRADSADLFNLQMARFVRAIRDRDLDGDTSFRDSAHVIELMEKLKSGPAQVASLVG